MTTDELRADQRLAARLREAIRSSPQLAQLDIDVEAHDGYLTVTGAVADDAQRQAIQRHAEGLDGCRGVFNRLEVGRPSPVSDAELVRQVRDALAAQVDGAPPPIEILAENGVITLSGEVVSHWERIIAEDAALAARGAAGVQNHLAVRPRRGEDDEALARDIHAALAYTRGVRETAIDVSVDAGVVRLTGRVIDEQERATAEAVARRFQVRDVCNQLKIAGPATEAADE